MSRVKANPLVGHVCSICGASMVIERFPFGYAVACSNEACRGNGDDLLYHLTPDAAEETYRKGGKPT